jgi:hypothetical protein
MRSLIPGATCALLLVAAAEPVRAQHDAFVTTPAPTALAAPVTIPLTRGAGHLRTIKVRVGRDSADYLFDTGGGITVISPQDSAMLGCTPGGKGFGVRLTGEALAGRTCANVTLGVGPLAVRIDAGVMDLAAMLGPRAPAVRGMISLNAFDGQALTLDLAHERLIVETPASLATRVKGMTPVPMRLATGEHGGQLTVYVGLRARNGAMLWFEWDSENNASTLISPQALALLGGDSTSRVTDLPVALAPGLEVVIPTMTKGNMIHDGGLSAGFLERAVWTVDLAHSRLWVGPVAPITTLAAVTAEAPAPVPPSRDPTGVYRTTTHVGARTNAGVMEIRREHGSLVAFARDVGEDDSHPLYDVEMRGDTLRYDIHIPGPVPVQVVFDGLSGRGTWGDGGVKRGGVTEAVKVR